MEGPERHFWPERRILVGWMEKMRSDKEPDWVDRVTRCSVSK